MVYNAFPIHVCILQVINVWVRPDISIYMTGTISDLTQPMNEWNEAWPQHPDLHALLFATCVASFASQRIMNIEGLWDRTYCLLSLSEKTLKSNHLHMSLQRQHFLLSYLKTLSVGLAVVKPATSRSVVRWLTNWANWSSVKLRVRGEIKMWPIRYYGCCCVHPYHWDQPYGGAEEMNDNLGNENNYVIGLGNFSAVVGEGSHGLIAGCFTALAAVMIGETS